MVFHIITERRPDIMDAEMDKGLLFNRQVDFF